MISRFIFLFVFIRSNEAARILAVFPTPSLSHQVVFRPLTEELARRGHEVVVITADPAFPKGKTPSNLTEIDVHEESYVILRRYIEKVSKGDRDFITQMIYYILDVILKSFETYADNKEIQDLIKTKQFDLLLIEAIARPALIFSHFYKLPVIQISSFGGTFDNFDVIGAPIHPILYRFCVRELNNNVDMMFLNVHPIFEGLRPVPPTVVYMGGIHQKPKKELPADLKSYLDSSKQGVIYISFGTNVVPSLLPPERIQAIVRVLADLPYNVLWKYDQDELPSKTDNIRIGKWFPQSDLLRHPNIKLFITQGGLQSTDEAITAGVPLIGVPILGDQWFNSEKYEYHKIGIKLDIETLNYDDLLKAVTTVINDDSYRHNIVRLRELMQDEPMKPLDRAMWWIEYVIRHRGAKHLRSPAANITWAEYLELEIVLTLLAGLLIGLSLFVTVLYLVCKTVLNAFSSKKGDKNKKKKL